MVKNLKSLLAGTVLLALNGCVTYTTTSYPSPHRHPTTITRTEHFYLSIQNVPSHHSMHGENFQNPTYNRCRPEPRRQEYSGHHKRH